MQPGQRKIIWRVVVLAAVLGAGVWLVAWLTRPDAGQLLRDAERALADDAPQEAQRLAEKALARRPGWPRALLVAGDARVRLEDYAGAFGAYEQVPDGAGRESIDAAFRAAQVLMDHLHRASDAEARFRRVLARDPRHRRANARLAELLGRESRRREAVPMIVELLRQEVASVDLLVLLGARRLYDHEWLQRCREETPGDAAVLLGLADHALDARRMEEAAGLLRSAVARDPELIEAQARLGRLLLDIGAETELAEWHDRLPPRADDHPVVWQVRAEWAERLGNPRVAVRCSWEALRRDPNLRATNYQLAQLLLELGEQERAAPFVRRALQLQDLREIQENLLTSEHTSLDPLRGAARQMEALGRAWEAWGWYLIAEKLAPRETWIAESKARLQPILEKNPPPTLESANPARQVDLSEFPLPDRETFRPRGSTSRNPPPEEGGITFVNSAEEAGLRFEYFNSGDPNREPGDLAASGKTGRPRAAYEQKMYEFSGGGIAVLDYDGDGWPDIYLTQGCRWPPGVVRSLRDRTVGPRRTTLPRPPGQNESEHLDRLYRNAAGVRFEDVTAEAGLVETRFSQGVAAGDYDGDGFPDLYVANIGPNRLYRNNGDGTFTDVTDEAFVVAPLVGRRSAGAVSDAERPTSGATTNDEWTTSCLMADLNGDGLPEIYAVNYLAGDDLFERVCRHNDGNPRMCMPFQFPAAQDRLYWNRGDGRFEDVTGTSGVAVPDGKGLGIVAADFDGAGRLDLFVANDTVPNFFFANSSADRHAPPAFVERGLTSGLAFNRDGRAEGCMGVAADDADGDGRLDLFVTNFHNETNTLYLRREGGLFADRTEEAGLAEPSLSMLGFGTQFLDADLDGRPDLIVTNGHIDDLRPYGRPYRMPPQFFRGIANGRFAEPPAESLGPFFEQECLGRGLARIDWNRDGREEAVISHLDRPAALLTNTTRTKGRFVAIELRGVESARDAIGATVRLKAGERTITRQLTAGDGYQASNQRQLVFGLGRNSRADELVIRWPSGLEQTLPGLAADGEYLVVEGRQRAMRRVR